MKKTNKNESWRPFYNAIANESEYGKLFLHSEIEQMTGLCKDSPEWKKMIVTVKKEIQAISRRIESQRGLGYRLLPPDEHVDASLKKFKSGYRDFKTGRKILEDAPVDEMTDIAKQQHRELYDFTTRIIATTSGGLKGAETSIKYLEMNNDRPTPSFINNN